MVLVRDLLCKPAVFVLLIYLLCWSASVLQGSDGEADPDYAPAVDAAVPDNEPREEIQVDDLPDATWDWLDDEINDDYSLLNDGGDDESTHLQEAVATMQQREVSTERSESTGCVICKETLADTTTWDCASCTQSYHRHCIKRSYEYCDRCPYCREMITLDVEDDEVLVVDYVPAPPTCFICTKADCGIILEGPQCSHICGIE